MTDATGSSRRHVRTSGAATAGQHQVDFQPAGQICQLTAHSRGCGLAERLILVDRVDPDPSVTPDWAAESNQEGARFGRSVGTAGDVNADGYDERIVGANAYEYDQTDEGLAVVVRGRPTP